MRRGGIPMYETPIRCTRFLEKPKFTGYILNEDNVCAEIKDDKVKSFTELAPLYIKNGGNFLEWISDRSADLNRSYMRNILSHLRIPVKSERESVEYVNAVSLTDTYWIRETNSPLSFEDVKFTDNIFFKASLSGDPDIFSKSRDTTPELTTGGSYNKGWLPYDGDWAMYKAGTPLEVWSEVFTSKLARLLNLHAVLYRCIDGYSVCGNFIEYPECLEPAKSIIGNNTGYIHNIKTLQQINPTLVKQYLDIMFLDAIVRNGDRHEFNYGVITERGVIKRLAPNFDNNMSMFWNGIPNNLMRKDSLVTEFIEAINAHQYQIPPLSMELVHKAYKYAIAECSSIEDLDIPFDAVKQFCLNAYEQIIN